MIQRFAMLNGHKFRSIRRHGHDGSEKLKIGALAVLTATICVSCGRPPPSANDRAEAERVYMLVLERISQHMRLDPPLLLNPMLGRVNTLVILNEGGMYIPNDVDSTMVPVLVTKNHDYRLCDHTASGFCVGGPDVTMVTLSEIRDFGEHGLGVIALIMTNRDRAHQEAYYLFLVKRG